jgi:hypothetical protein
MIGPKEVGKVETAIPKVIDSSLYVVGSHKIWVTPKSILYWQIVKVFTGEVHIPIHDPTGFYSGLL